MSRIFFLLASSLLIFLGLQLWVSMEYPLPGFIRFHLADLLCRPVVLSICLIAVRIIKNDPNIRLSAYSIFSLFVFYSVYFELLMPEIHQRYTADPLDVLMYFFGSLIFYIVQKEPGKHVYSR